MSQMFKLLAVVCTCVVGGAIMQVVRAEEPSSPPKLVLAELFTSEGCSSCPPADRLLAEIVKSSPVPGVTIVPLSLHVDYWNSLGWADSYSTKPSTERQVAYQRALGNRNIYTPQLVVDGSAECVGSDRATVTKLIRDAAERPKAEVSISATPSSDATTCSVKVELAKRDALPRDEQLRVMIAVTEDGLTSTVRRGENTGHTLSHVAVVRSLVDAGAVAADPHARPIEMTLKLDPAWKLENLHIVAFVQSAKDLHVYGAAIAPITSQQR